MSLNNRLNHSVGHLFDDVDSYMQAFSRAANFINTLKSRGIANKQGMFRIPAPSKVNDFGVWIKHYDLIISECVIARSSVDASGEHLEIVAYSEHFDEVTEGNEIPSYYVVLRDTQTGTKFERFQRVDL